MELPYKSITTFLKDRAQNAPNKIAIEEGHREITYGDLSALIEDLVRHLAMLEIERESVITVWMSSGVRLVASLYSIFDSNGVYLLLSDDFSDRQVREIYTQTNSQILIIEEEEEERIVKSLQAKNLSIRYLVVISDQYDIVIKEKNGDGYDRSNHFPNSGRTPEILVDPTQGNYIFYTSGSTGAPKAILGMHGSLSHFIQWQMTEFSIDETCRVSQLASLSFDASLRDILLPLSAGGTLCIPSATTRSNISLLVQWLSSTRISVIHTVPTLFRVIIRELKQLQGDDVLSFDQLHYIFLSGEMIFAKDVINWQSLNGNRTQLVNFYGPTETTMIKSFHVIKDVPSNPSAPIHVGNPIANTVMAIIHNNKICRPGEVGEVYIKTKYWTKGYYKDEQNTRAAFVPNPINNNETDRVYKTGDKGKYLKDGSIEILGRVDREIKINGIRINLQAIQNAVLEVPGVEDAYVRSIAHDDTKEMVCYFLASSPNVTGGMVRKFIEGILDRKTIPTYFVKLDAFPVNSNGKINELSLPIPIELLLQSDQYEAPQTITEIILENIWREVLQANIIGRNGMFFNLGGTSLRAMQVISRIYKKFKVTMSIKDFFAHNSLSAMATIVDKAAITSVAELKPLEKSDYYETTNAQKRIWTLYQYQTQQTAYTISDAYCITGELKVPSLERAFRKLLSRHEALRTIFKEVDGVAYQAVRNLDEVPSILEFKDIRGAIDIARCQREEIDELFMHVFDLVKGPLLRCKILQVDTNVYVLIVVISHIIADAWSMKILFSDLVSLYELELGNDTKSKLVPIAIQLKEYSLWLNNLQKTSKYEEDRKYWLDQFSDDHLPVLDINRASPRPPVRSFTGRTIRFSLNKSLTADIVRFCEQVGATPYMVLLAQINTLLYCHSGSKEIVVGNPVSGRMRSEFENVIGLFVITLPIKCKFKAQNTFGELVDIVKESTLNAYLHELYPLDELIGEINANVDQSRSPLFDVMVQLQDRSIASSVSNVKSLEISEERIEHFSSKFDLTFDFKIRTEHIDVVLEYNSILFDEDFIRVFQDDFLMIVEAVLKDPTITPQRIRKERMSLDVNQVQDFRNI